MAWANAEAGLKLANTPVAVVLVLVLVLVVVVCQHIGQRGEWAEAVERAGRYGKVAHSYTQKDEQQNYLQIERGEGTTKWLMLVIFMTMVLIRQLQEPN